MLEKNPTAVRSLTSRCPLIPLLPWLKPSRHPYYLHSVPDNCPLYLAFPLLAVSSPLLPQATGDSTKSMDSQYRTLLCHQHRKQLCLWLQYISACPYHPP